jgi:hypothetical protein
MAASAFGRRAMTRAAFAVSLSYAPFRHYIPITVDRIARIDYKNGFVAAGVLEPARERVKTPWIKAWAGMYMPQNMDC